jgi:phosphoenolpyruvate carboxylase
MGDNNKNKKNKNEIKIITDKLKNSEYTFVDGSFANSTTNLPLNRGEDGDLSRASNNNKQDNDDEKSVKRHSNRFKKTDYLRFKANNAARAQSRQNHSPVYE